MPPEIQTSVPSHVRADEWHAPWRWRLFRIKTWAQNTQDSKTWLTVSKLKSRTAIEAVACNSKTISASFTELIADEHGTILPGKAHRLVLADEKGFSQRADNVTRGVVSLEL